MRKIIAISAVLVILTVFVSAASACINCGFPAKITIPTPQAAGGTFNTYSSGTFSGTVGGSSGSLATGCDVVTGSNTKITQVGNGGLAETIGYAGASGTGAYAESSSISGGQGDFSGSGSATGVAQ